MSTYAAASTSCCATLAGDVGVEQCPESSSVRISTPSVAIAETAPHHSGGYDFDLNLGRFAGELGDGGC